MVVSGSSNRWYVAYNHPIGNIYIYISGIYIAILGGLYMLYATYPSFRRNNHSHSIHVWYIYLHLVDLYGKCRLSKSRWLTKSTRSQSHTSFYLKDKCRSFDRLKGPRFEKPRCRQ